jgi:hypothetical protein
MPGAKQHVPMKTIKFHVRALDAAGRGALREVQIRTNDEFLQEFLNLSMVRIDSLR